MGNDMRSILDDSDDISLTYAKLRLNEGYMRKDMMDIAETFNSPEALAEFYIKHESAFRTINEERKSFLRKIAQEAWPEKQKIQKERLEKRKKFYI